MGPFFRRIIVCIWSALPVSYAAPFQTLASFLCIPKDDACKTPNVSGARFFGQKKDHRPLQFELTGCRDPSQLRLVRGAYWFACSPCFPIRVCRRSRSYLRQSLRPCFRVIFSLCCSSAVTDKLDLTLNENLNAVDFDDEANRSHPKWRQYCRPLLAYLLGPQVPMMP